MASSFNRNRQSLSNIISSLSQESAQAARRSDKYTYTEDSISSEILEEDITLFGHAIQSSDYVEGESGWRISGSGTAEFENVRVRGEIQTDNGVIGGYAISETSLLTGSGGTTFAIDSGGVNPAIYAGADDPAEAPFSVTNAGFLTSESGLIAGWSISATEIFYGAGSTKIALSTDATPKIYVGAGTYSSNDTPFYLDSDGALSLSTVLVWDGTTLDLVGAGDIDCATVTTSGDATVDGKATVGSIKHNYTGKVYRADTSSQSISDSTVTAVSWLDTLFDYANMHTTGATDDRVISSITGVFSFSCTVYFSAASGGSSGSRIVRLVRYNSSDAVQEIIAEQKLTSVDTAATPSLTVFGVTQMSENDYVKAEVYQDSGVSITLSSASGFNPSLSWFLVRSS